MNTFTQNNEAQRMIPRLENTSEIYQKFGNGNVTFVYDMVMRSIDKKEFDCDYTPEFLVGRDVWNFANGEQQEIISYIIGFLASEYALPLVIEASEEGEEETYFLATVLPEDVDEDEDEDETLETNLAQEGVENDTQQ